MLFWKGVNTTRLPALFALKCIGGHQGKGGSAESFLILGLAELYMPLMLMLYTITFSDQSVQFIPQTTILKLGSPGPQ